MSACEFVLLKAIIKLCASGFTHTDIEVHLVTLHKVDTLLTVCLSFVTGDFQQIVHICVVLKV